MAETTSIGYVPVNKAGDTMTGFLTLNADPSNALEAATKQYVDATAGGGAPSTATYITQTPDAGLSNEQALSALATGILKSTTGTGVVSIAVPGTDYYQPGGTDIPVADGGTGVSSFTAYAVICGGTTGTGALQSVASVGTSGQILTSNGAGVLPTFQTASGVGGSLTKIATATASSSTTIDFANNLSATYDNYLVVIEGLLPATNAVTFQMRVGTGAGPTYQTTSYSGNIYSNVGGTTFASGTGAMDCNPQTRLSNTASRISTYQLTVTNANASTDKAMIGVGGYWDSTASADANAIVSGRWQSSTVITSLRFLMSSGNISSGTFKLYGISN